jgi:predicted permease
MVFGVVFRMMFGPAIFLAVATGFGLAQTEVLIGIIVLVGPAASNGYILAKKMGGDADLYADILAWQTIMSMLILPLLILAVTTA